MKSKYSLFFALAVSFFFLNLTSASAQKKNTFEINGKISGTITHKAVFLADIYNARVTPFDTVYINMEDSTFKFKGTLEDGIMSYIILNSSAVVPIVVLPNSNQNISITLSENGMQFEIDGKNSEPSVKIRQFLEAHSRNEMAIETITQMFRNGQVEISKASEYENNYKFAVNENKAMVDFMISDSSNPLGAYFVFNAFLEEPNKDNYTRVLRAFDVTNPNSKYAKELKRRYEIDKTIMVGEYAPEIKLPTPDGDSISLNSLRGKYVLIDFWASWCGPCRRENPNNKRIYERFSGKGLEIYAVSLDKSKDAWVNAIKQDDLPWIHVSDVAYWNSAPAKIYKVHSIPATFLLDKEGRIVAKNLRGQELENFLAEVIK